MPIRIYEANHLAVGAYTLNEAASHHVARVLRSAIGDDVILFN